jgi:hypothetical protein
VKGGFCAVELLFALESPFSLLALLGDRGADTGQGAGGWPVSLDCLHVERSDSALWCLFVCLFVLTQSPIAEERRKDIQVVCCVRGAGDVQLQVVLVFSGVWPILWADWCVSLWML